MAYATVTDLESRIGRTLTSSEAAQAETMLDDAAVILNKLVNLDGSAEQLEALGIVSCNMVIRLLGTNDTDMFGATSATITAGPYSQSRSWSTPYGDMYLTKLDKRILGITSGYITTIEPKIGGYYD